MFFFSLGHHHPGRGAAAAGARDQPRRRRRARRDRPRGAPLTLSPCVTGPCHEPIRRPRPRPPACSTTAASSPCCATSGYPHREPGERAGRRPARLPRGRARARSSPARLREPHPRQPGRPPRPFLIAERHESPTCRPCWSTATATPCSACRSSGAPGWSPGGWWSRASAGNVRGTADNKGQHLVNLAGPRTGDGGAAAAVSASTSSSWSRWARRSARRAAGGCARRAQALAADLLIRLGRAAPERRAPDAVPRLPRRLQCRAGRRPARGRATIPATGRGCCATPASCSPTPSRRWSIADGRILVEGLRPPPIPAGVRAALAGLEVGGGPTDPAIDPSWGEPGLSAAEKLFAWNTLDVLAFKTGNPESPLNAVPPRAVATLQMRFVVGTDWENAPAILRAHLDRHGFGSVEVRAARQEVFQATRLDVEDPWVDWALDSIRRSTARTGAAAQSRRLAAHRRLRPPPRPADPVGAAFLPGLLAARPGRASARPGVREGLVLMAGLFWDLARPARRLSRAGGRVSEPVVAIRDSPSPCRRAPTGRTPSRASAST